MEQDGGGTMLATKSSMARQSAITGSVTSVHGGVLIKTLLNKGNSIGVPSAFSFACKKVNKSINQIPKCHFYKLIWENVSSIRYRIS